MVFKSFIVRIYTWHQRRQQFRRVRQELEQYSDRELRDLGIPRWDIPKFARASVT